MFSKFKFILLKKNIKIIKQKIREKYLKYYIF
jgi:hypothetical protein